MMGVGKGGAGGEVVVPVFVWGPQAPSHRVNTLTLLPDNRTLVSGTQDGQLLVWDNHEAKLMLFTQDSPITALSPADVDPASPMFVSASRDGRTCLWDATDGRCVESVASPHIHTFIRPHIIRGGSGRQLRLFCSGHYPEVLILEPFSLLTIATLSSRVEPDWINAFSIFKPPQKHDIVIGLSGSGMVKIWSLIDMEPKGAGVLTVYEDESKQISCQGATHLDPCHLNQRAMVFTGPQEWQVLDAGDFSVVVREKSPSGQTWLQAAFTKIDKLIAFCSDGTAYLYQLPRKAILGEAAAGAPPFDHTFCYCRLLLHPSQHAPLSATPVFLYVDRDRANTNVTSLGAEVIRGDRDGRIIRWNLPVVTDRQIASLQQEHFRQPPDLKPSSMTSLDQTWENLPQKPPGIVGELGEVGITASLYVGSQGRLIVGRADGIIFLISATQTIIKQLLSHSNPPEWPPVRSLDGHNGEPITCLLYPFEEHPRYDPAHLLSGGQDFAVNLWDLKTGARVMRFCVQAGPILRLSVPPPTCNPRILQTVCSVAGDHSVALIGLKEQKLVLLASRHLYPVSRIFWRPLDDFLLVETQDSTIFVWQMETGHLDRVVRGVVGEEMIAGCEEAAAREAEEEEEVDGGEAGASQAVQMIRAIKHKNMAAIKKVANIGERGGDGRVESEIDISTLPPPMTLSPIRACKEDSDSHVILFHIEALIIGLLADERSRSQQVSSSNSDTSIGSEQAKGDASPSLSGLLARAKDKAESVLRTSPVPQRKRTETEAGRGAVAESLHTDVAQLLMSLLHGWHLDKDLDRVGMGKLGLLTPKDPGLCFGLVSRTGALSVRTPNALAPAQPPPTPLPPFQAFSTLLHWSLSPSITTYHLLAIIATANTLMSMPNTAFLPQHEQKRRLIKRMSTKTSSPGTGEVAEAMAAEASQIKQGWSLLAALHCVLLPELVCKTGKNAYAAPRIELLARRWQERCLEIREASQALLLRELNRLGPEGRRALVDTWSPFLPTFLDPSLSIFGTARPLGSQPQTPAGPPPPIVPAHSHPPTSTHSNTHTPASAPVMPPSAYSPLLTAAVRVAVEGLEGEAEGTLVAVRRKQATAVVVLGVVGAEFGEEMSGTPGTSPSTASSAPAPPKGFSAGDHGLARATAQALLELLVQPSSPILPAYSPLRRAAMDLLGRGFVVWQPYLDISKVLLGLLDLASPADKLLPTGPIQFPLSPVADAARTARHALILIASARPPAFITALSKEVARHNASAAQAGLQHSQSPLIRARSEILRIIEVLIEKQYQHVLQLLIAVGEILVHCLDTSLLKTQTLGDVFPPIAKFYMVSYCSNTRRIAFGSTSGSVALHELRASKSQTFQAHSKGVTALSFSEDGKSLASYSADEGKVNFWSASGSFLGMGASQVKLVKQVPAPSAFPIQSPGGTPLQFRARLVWVGPKALTLLLPNGKEHRFSM